MNREQTRAALSAALDRWHQLAEDPNSSGRDVAASFEHIEVFALASLAQELHEIAQTLQARHEEAIEGRRSYADRIAEPDVVNVRTMPDGSIRKAASAPCVASHGVEPTRRCTRPLGHAGEHVDAAGERWGADAG